MNTAQDFASVLQYCGTRSQNFASASQHGLAHSHDFASVSQYCGTRSHNLASLSQHGLTRSQNAAAGR